MVKLIQKTVERVQNEAQADVHANKFWPENSGDAADSVSTDLVPHQLVEKTYRDSKVAAHLEGDRGLRTENSSDHCHRHF